MRASLRLIGKNKNRFPKNLISFRELEKGARRYASKGLRIYGFADREREHEFLLQRCMEVENGQKTLAILFRTNRLLDRFAALLKKQRIPFSTEAGAKLVLMTVHGSKGLEFDHVVIPDCNERNFPHGTLLEETTVEEERRLFYVGMTRAKDVLELFYVAGNQKRPAIPSRFLAEASGS